MSICAIAGQVGTEYVMGARVGMDPETIAHSGLVLLWGANPVSTGHHMWKFVDAARKQGAHVVAIDPVRTRTAEKVDEHLAPLPGTDGALALALLNVVVERGGADEDYLAGNALGWEALRGRIEEWPPQRAAQVCGLEEATIAALGERLARTRPTAIKLAMGMQRHAGGGEAVRLISCIPAVTGDWRHLGGGVTYDTRGFFGGDWQALWRDDLRPPGTRSLVMTQLASSLRDADPPVEALFVYNANPLVSNPAQREVRRELAREDLFTVVVDHFLTDTARLADIVLPATMQPEHADLHLGYGHLYVAWNEPAVAPRGECLPNSEIFRRLAAALDLDEPCLYDSDEEMARAVLGSGHPSLEGITLERLRREGSVRLALPDPFVPFEQGFPTPSGRVELVSERAAADGFDAVPNFVPPTEVTSADAALADYPLSLIVGASHFFLNSIFANKPALADKQGPPLLAMHPADAETRELADGEAVEIFNARGSWRATLSVSDGVRPGVVAATKGRWLASFDGESSPNATVAERDADMGHGAVFHDNRVQVSGLRERLEAV
jgi:anaerobic selenocysteine-containing dehydrogenase